MVNKKEGAVEWLVGKYRNQGFLYEEDIEQAKAMEKEQIKEAHWNGGEIFSDTGKLITPEQYYNETYGQN